MRRMGGIVTKYVTGNGSRGVRGETEDASSPAEADDVAVGIFDVEVLRPPGGRREGLEDRHTVRDALLVEGFDAVDSCRGVEMLVVAAVLSLGVVPGCFFQVKFESVQITDGVETIPRLAECEA